MSAQGQPSSSRPPQRVASTSSLSSSVSVAPSSPGPSISLRAAAQRSPTPGSASGYASPNLSYLNAAAAGGGGVASSSSGIAGRMYPNAGASYAMDGKERSASSSSTIARTASHQHNRRRPTLMGGGGSKQQLLLGRGGHLAQFPGAAAAGQGANPPRLSPPLLVVNGLERPEDVDISSIGRIPAASSYPNHQNGGYTTPASTSAGVDALFSRFGVKEVRSISVRGAALAEGKREELRTMVGARYRDLLGAADSIVRMRKASSSLLGKLARARDECDRETMTARAQESDLTRSRVMLPRASTPMNMADGSDADIQGHTPYSIATLVKLLLDAPEHIWRQIEREDYLSAARLESIGRAVYRELASTRRSGRGSRPTMMTEGPTGEAVTDNRNAEGEESDTEQDEQDDDLLAAFPLMQSTGDILDQLRPQISQRAKLHLRTWEASVQAVAEALASIIMLDNASIPEVFESLLEQRSKTLSAVFVTDPDSGTLGPPRRPSTLPVSVIKASIAGLPQEEAMQVDVAVDYTIQRVQEGLGLILQTLEHAQSVFVAPVDASSKDQSCILSLLSAIQRTPSAALDSNDPPAVSAYASASPVKASLPNTNGKAAAEDGILAPVLNTLPNAPVLLRYLPSQILSFTPFIDTSSSKNDLPTSSVSEKLESWLISAVSVLEAGITSLLSSLDSASQLAVVRQALLQFLASQPTATKWSTQASTLRTSFSAILERRFTEIFTARLQSLAESLPNTLSVALTALAESKEDSDTTDFLLAASSDSASAFGSVPFATLNSSITLAGTTRGSGNAAVPAYVVDLYPTRPTGQVEAFEVFRNAMRARVQGRSPILDACLCGLEAKSRDIRTDVTRWLNGGEMEVEKNVKERYLVAVKQSFGRMEETFRQALEKQRTEAEQLFLGNLALYVAVQSSFLSDIALLEDLSAEFLRPARESLLAIERSSRSQWRDRAVSESMAILSNSFDAALDKPVNPDTSKPAEYVQSSLGVLLKAARALGSHRAQAVPEAIHELLAAYEKQLIHDILPAAINKFKQLPEKEAAKRTLSAKQLRTDVNYLKELLGAAVTGKRREDWTAVDTELQKLVDAPETDDEAGRQAFLRSQSLLAPILSAAYRSVASDTKATALLPFGAPLPVSANDTKLFLAKPGSRFALLQVSQTAA